MHGPALSSSKISKIQASKSIHNMSTIRAAMTHHQPQNGAPFESDGSERSYGGSRSIDSSTPREKSSPSHYHPSLPSHANLDNFFVESPPESPRKSTWVYEPADSGIRRVIQNVDFKWYGSTMGTGIVSILLFTFSETYPASQDLLYKLSLIFFIMNIVLFLLIFIATCLRYAMYPRLLVMLLSDPGQAMYLGTFPMGFATLITMTVNVAVPHLGPSWATVAWVLWWVDVLVSMLVALGIPWLLQTLHHGIVDLEKMTAGWLLPIVAPIVAAATGAGVASVLQPNEALITIVTSYVILGTGLTAALAIITIYLLRIATKKLPPTEHMVSTFLPLGPLGQGGFAFQQLGQQAQRVFPLTETLPAVDHGSKLLAGDIFYTMGVMAAMMLWGFGLMWMFFAALSVTRQKVPFSLGWWAFTFPLGVFATSTLALAEGLPSATFRVLGTVFGCVVMAFWVLVTGILVFKLVSGKKWDIFKAPEVTGPHNEIKLV